MKVGDFDTDNRVLIVAEIGNNHEGDPGLAEALIERAAQSGADAVKFQTFVPELFVSRQNPDRLNRMRNFQLSFSQFEALAHHAKSAGVIFFSTPLDLESAEFLAGLQPLFKIASGDNNFWPLIEKVASFGKPTIISTGLSTAELLDDIHSFWRSQPNSAELAYLHCLACYPAPLEQANLGAIHFLRDYFKDVTIGYSDHTLGIDASVYAVAAGARIIEKHFTLDHEYSNFRDHKLSANPEELKQMVRRIRQVEKMLGNAEKAPQDCQEELRIVARRSIAVKVDLPAGHELELADICWIRPGSGIAPGSEGQVVGRRINRSLSKGTIIFPKDLVEGNP
jgi:sialic acid synthase SpsE